MSNLEGTVVALTGAASGIGLATARLLAQQGTLLSLADLNASRLAEVAAELRPLYPTSKPDNRSIDPVLTTVLDVRRLEDCHRWIRQTMGHFNQPLAGAVNLAGVFGPSIAQEVGAVRNITDQECDFVMDVNCRGLLNCLRAELPFMQTGSQGCGGGSIVNAASIAGIVGVQNNGPYVASEHAVVGLTRTVAKEEGMRAIRVNAIAP